MKNIVLDFGHGSIDGNGHYTTSPNKMHKFPNGQISYEGVLNRQIGSKVHKYLSRHDTMNIICTVCESHATDLPLSKRVSIANELDPNVTMFVSIHCNYSPEHNAQGFEIFTSPGETKSDEIANNIYKSVEKEFADDLKLRSDTSDGDFDKEAKFYVLVNTKCPAVLIECGFFDNWEEYRKLSSDYYQDRMAKAIYQGIIGCKNE